MEAVAMQNVATCFCSCPLAPAPACMFDLGLQAGLRNVEFAFPLHRYLVVICADTLASKSCRRELSGPDRQMW